MLRSVRRIPCRSLSSSTQTLSYIPYKTKEEILGLYLEDPQRWNTATLSTRFNAPRQNVDALIQLGALRKERESRIKEFKDDDRKRLEESRKRALDAWSQLAESIPMSYSPHRLASPSRLGKKDAVVDRKEAEAGKDEQKLDGAEGAVVGEVSNGEIGEIGEDGVEEEVIEVKNSVWADQLGKEIGNMERDVERKTRFAFIEIGEQSDVQRAVWIRENSGELRFADNEERRLLLDEVGVRDARAWKP